MEELICRYCGRECKNGNSLRQHETRCKSNPNHVVCFGNKGHMPKHLKAYYIKPIKANNGDILDITGAQLETYRETHPVCEICKRPVEETVKWQSKYSAKSLSIDHDHSTKRFRGLLCQVCNRQLGWYEKNKAAIDTYLSKEIVIN